jgi:hypothetical protein
VGQLSLPLHEIARLYSVLSMQDYQPRSPSVLEKRGLPVGTRRLIAFADQHQVSISEIKALHQQGLVRLTIVHRENRAIRNKQEWWITPQEQYDLVHYWQEQGMTYTPCAQCPHPPQDAFSQAG